MRKTLVGIKFERIRLKSLVDTEGNPQTMSDAEYQGLVKSIKKDGWLLDAAVAWKRPDGQYQIISGHHRIKAAIEAGILEADIKIIDGIDEEKARLLVLESNQRRGHFDDKLFNSFVSDLSETFDIDVDTIFDKIGVIDEEQPEAVEDDYEIPDEIKTDIKLGDLFEIGGHRLLCGDNTDIKCVERLMNGEKADIVFTDPPYGVAIGDKNKILNTIMKTRCNIRNIKDDNLKSDKLHKILLKAFNNLKTVLNDCCTVFVTSPSGGGPGMMMMMMMRDAGLEVKHILMWYKNAPTFSLGRLDYNYQHEPILLTWNKTHKFYGKGQHKTSVWKIDKPIRNKEHPTMKPIALIENALLNNSKSDDICIDIYLGSGSTMVACHQLNRKCYGIEIEPHYCQVIIDRMLKLDNSLKIKKNGKPYKIGL